MSTLVISSIVYAIVGISYFTKKYFYYYLWFQPSFGETLLKSVFWIILLPGWTIEFFKNISSKEDY